MADLYTCLKSLINIKWNTDTRVYIYIYMHNSREYVRKYIYMTINIMDISAGTSGHTFNNITADNFQLSEISLNGSKIYFLRLFMYICRVPYH